MLGSGIIIYFAVDQHTQSSRAKKQQPLNENNIQWCFEYEENSSSEAPSISQAIEIITQSCLEKGYLCE